MGSKGWDQSNDAPPSMQRAERCLRGRTVRRYVKHDDHLIGTAAVQAERER